jgi:hypothetical protein
MGPARRARGPDTYTEEATMRHPKMSPNAVTIYLQSIMQQIEMDRRSEAPRLSPEQRKRIDGMIWGIYHTVRG